ncbi:MAG TPA: Mrp/NBP35 family ATP-binding protein [Bellilinea sp.]|nr:Mrp/NBP35 family ATP-binding protein [Bellilinea sp.]
MIENITSADVLAALSEVEEPELHRDLVSLGMIENIEIKDGVVRFDLVLTTPACPLRDEIMDTAKDAVMQISGVRDVVITLPKKVLGDGKERKIDGLQIKNVIAVASGKGGVGKSTVSVNLAIALQQHGASVGLLDADIYGPNIPKMMGVEKLPLIASDKIPTAEAYGIKLMSIGFLVPQDRALIWRGPMLHSAVRQFLADVDWGELDYLIVDLPPGTGDVQLSLTQTIPITGGVLVTLPQQVSYDDAFRGLQMFQQMGVPIVGVVENMSYLMLPDGTRMEVFGSGGGEKLAREANVELMGQIPMESDVRAGGDAGKPILITNPDSTAAKVMTDVAKKVAARVSVINATSERLPDGS